MTGFCSKRFEAIDKQRARGFLLKTAVDIIARKMCRRGERRRPQCRSKNTSEGKKEGWGRASAHM